MNPIDRLRFSLRDLIGDVEVGPAHVPLALLGEFQKDVADFLRGVSRDVDLTQVRVSVESGSLTLVVSGLLTATTLWEDLAHLAAPDALNRIDPRRAGVLKHWQAVARIHPHRRYAVADEAQRVLVAVDARTSFVPVDDAWVQVEKYLNGKIIDMGGKTNASVQLELENGQTLTASSSHDLWTQDEQNLPHLVALLHVTAEENLRTAELRNVQLLAFEPHQPSYDEGEFQRMVERGTKAWQDVGTPTAWIEALRGGQS